jgi:flagellar basal-body rod protein FlgC
MSVFDTMAVSASGLTAQRLRLDLIAGNLANVQSTRSSDGGPYRRRVPVFEAREAALAETGSPLVGGVQVVAVLSDAGPPRLVYDPGHPDADGSGYVAYPNIEPVMEMADLISCTRSYEANLACLSGTKRMAKLALDLVV